MEWGGNTMENEMELYTTPDTMNLDTLKMFCIEKKDEWSSEDKLFHYLVFFDSKDNAVFPNNPMTAFYGIEEEPKIHIRAYYEYNRVNGYSKLTFYEENSWESSPITFDL
jgi:hypothetical protein